MSSPPHPEALIVQPSNLKCSWDLDGSLTVFTNDVNWRCWASLKSAISGWSPEGELSHMNWSEKTVTRKFCESADPSLAWTDTAFVLSIKMKFLITNDLKENAIISYSAIQWRAPRIQLVMINDAVHLNPPLCKLMPIWAVHGNCVSLAVWPPLILPLWSSSSPLKTHWSGSTGTSRSSLMISKSFWGLSAGKAATTVKVKTANTNNFIFEISWENKFSVTFIPFYYQLVVFHWFQYYAFLSSDKAYLRLSITLFYEQKV